MRVQCRRCIFFGDGLCSRRGIRLVPGKSRICDLFLPRYTTRDKVRDILAKLPPDVKAALAKKSGLPAPSEVAESQSKIITEANLAKKGGLWESVRSMLSRPKSR